MGHDDNTPLTGVTGGGLPTEIWRETMVRIHEGVPLRPLPMRPPDGALRAQQSPAAQAPGKQQRDIPNTTEGLIDMLLREILGGNRNN